MVPVVDDDGCETLQPARRAPAQFAIPPAYSEAMAQGLLDRMPLWFTLADLRKANPYPVLPENASAVKLFLALGTQWRHNEGDGSLLGLIYEAIPMAERMSDITATPQQLDDLRELEAAAIYASENLAKAAREAAKARG